MGSVAIGADPYASLDKFLHYGRTERSVDQKYISHPRLRAERLPFWETKDGAEVPTRAISIILHQTPIVTYTDNGRCLLTTGGWFTSTTRERIREYLPPGVNLTTDSDEWFVTFGWAEQTYQRRHRDSPWRQHDNGSWERVQQPMEIHTYTRAMPTVILPWDMCRELHCNTDGVWEPTEWPIATIAENVTNPVELPDNERSKAIAPYLDRYMRRILTGHIKYDVTCPSCIAGLDGNEHIFEHLIACEAPMPMLLGMGILALVVVLFGLFPGIVVESLITPAAHALVDQGAYISAVLGGA